MSKNRNVRNARAIRTQIKPVVFIRENLKVGIVYQYRNDWLFTLDATGCLRTDVGDGLAGLAACYASHNHWFKSTRIIHPRLIRKA